MINLKAATLSDPGLVREENEDSVWAQVIVVNKVPLGLFVVCDGMGGHMGGKYASYWALEAIKRDLADIFVAEDPRDTVLLPRRKVTAAKSPQPEIENPREFSDEMQIEQRILSAINKANQVVYDYARHKPEKALNAGTTLAMAVVRGNYAVIANIGDSRVYMLRNHQLRRITKDHSLVENLIASGQISPQDIFDHPQRNVIYRFLGQKGAVSADIFHEVLRPGDFLLLCTDGLWEMLRDESGIVETIEKSKNLEAACQDLIKAAKSAGGEDNIGVVLAHITRGLPRPFGSLQEALW